MKSAREAEGQGNKDSHQTSLDCYVGIIRGKNFETCNCKEKSIVFCFLFFFFFKKETSGDMFGVGFEKE